MKISRLKEMLDMYPSDTEVYAWDVDIGEWVPITGLLHCPGDDPPSVYVQTDEVE